jgi:hypothetical protein
MENNATELNAGIRRAIEQLANEADAARQSQLFRAYLRTSAVFWDYSWHNQMLIWRQKPDASFVGGFQTWLKCGRYVRKGEKGIGSSRQYCESSKVQVLAPSIACVRTASISGACGGNEARSART